MGQKGKGWDKVCFSEIFVCISNLGVPCDIKILPCVLNKMEQNGISKRDVKIGKWLQN